MGRREGRRLTREVKIAKPQLVARKDILEGIEAGEPLKHIADRVRVKYPMGRDKALRIVTAEFDVMAKGGLDLDAEIEVNL